VLSQAERLALYGLPDFDEFQRTEYFAFTGAERSLAERRKGSAAQLHCMLQIGYFRAKHVFFTLSAKKVPADDVAFLVEPGERLPVPDNTSLLPLPPYSPAAQPRKHRENNTLGASGLPRHLACQPSLRSIGGWR
jgi:hypothetical protein